MEKFAITAEELSYIILATVDEKRKKELILEQKRILSRENRVKQAIQKSLQKMNNKDKDFLS